MRQDTSTSRQPRIAGASAKIRLRDEHFVLVTNILGHTTEDARARFIGLDYKALLRARKGNVSHRFVASTLAALTAHAGLFESMSVPITFEALFDTVIESAEPGEQS